MNIRKLIALTAVMALAGAMSACFSQRPVEDTAEEAAPKASETLDQAFDRLYLEEYDTLTEEQLLTEQSPWLERCLEKVDSGKYSENYTRSDGEHSGSVTLVVFEDWIYYELTGYGGYELITCDGVGRKAVSGNWYYEDITLPEEHSYRSQLSTITEKMEFADSVEFTAENRTYLCERYTDGGKMNCYICFDRAGDIQCMTVTDGVRYNDFRNYSLSTEYGVYTAPVMEGLYDRIEQNYDPLYPKELHYENNLFDFSAERIRGENIDNPHIVEQYREFFDTAEEFSISISAQRGDLMMWNYATRAGEDYYYRSGTKKGREAKIITEYIEKDGQHFDRCYYEVEEEPYRLTSSGGGLYVYYLLQNNDHPGTDYVASFVEAYTVSINNEEYICEVWSMGGEPLYHAYCKDGEVVAMDVIFYDEHEETVIEYFRDEAETEYIVTPEQYLPPFSDEQ